MHHRLDCCTTHEISAALSDPTKCHGVILPIGSLEQHGPLLPLGCDMMIARSAAEALAVNFSNHFHFRALVLPDIAYTPSPGAEYTPGTISVGFDFTGQGLLEVIGGAMRTDWKFAIIINGHAHNHGRVIEASIAGSAGAFGRSIPIVVINLYDFLSLAQSHGLVPGSHAGEFETALLSYYTGYKPALSPGFTGTIRPRPPAVFGLPILPRSMDGVIAPEIPDLERALSVAAELGADLDSAVYNAAITNLDIYFEHWNA